MPSANACPQANLSSPHLAKPLLQLIRYFSIFSVLIKAIVWKSLQLSEYYC